MVKLPLNTLQLIMWILPLTLLQIHGNMFRVAKVQELEVSKTVFWSNLSFKDCILSLFSSEITFFSRTSFFIYFNEKKKLRRIRSIFDIKIDFESQNYAVFDLQFKNNIRVKNIFMAIFVVLWPYLLTINLSCLAWAHYYRRTVHNF